MKTIRLTPQRRKVISGRRDGPKAGGPSGGSRRPSGAMTGDPERRSPGRSASRPARSASGRNKGLDEPRTSHHQGDPGRPGPARAKRLGQEIEAGVFRDADRIRTRIESTFGVTYSASGVKGPLRRVGASLHEASGLFRKADVREQKEFAREHRRHERRAGPGARRYTVDACHPAWGVDLLYSRRLPTGQRFGVGVGVGDGRVRLDILGACRPDDHDHDHVDLRLAGESITGERSVKLPGALLARHPEAARFIPYLDNARCYSRPCVKEWPARHRQLRPVPPPACSPDLDPIERPWKSLREEASSRRLKTFEEMQAAAGVPDRPGDYRDELPTPMAGRLAIAGVEQAAA